MKPSATRSVPEKTNDLPTIFKDRTFLQRLIKFEPTFALQSDQIVFRILMANKLRFDTIVETENFKQIYDSKCAHSTSITLHPQFPAAAPPPSLEFLR